MRDCECLHIAFEKLTCANFSNIAQQTMLYTSHILLVYAIKVSSTLLKTFCEMERFAKGSSHENWQRIGKRAWYLRCSVSLSFVDDEVYVVMYRYMTWRHMTSLQMTSALSDIQILSWIRAWFMPMFMLHVTCPYLYQVN